MKKLTKEVIRFVNGEEKKAIITMEFEPPKVPHGEPSNGILISCKCSDPKFEESATELTTSKAIKKADLFEKLVAREMFRPLLNKGPLSVENRLNSYGFNG